MTSRDFAYWLQGLFELSDVTALNKKQTDLIRNHLALVFVHEIDPSMGDKAHQDVLTKIHHGKLPENPPPFYPTPSPYLASPFQTTGIDSVPTFNC